MGAWHAQETERAAFLLASLARLLGLWQMALPASLPAARQTAASFLSFAALPTAADTCAVHCPPVSPSEKVLHPTNALPLALAGIYIPEI